MPKFLKMLGLVFFTFFRQNYEYGMSTDATRFAPYGVACGFLLFPSLILLPNGNESLHKPGRLTPRNYTFLNVFAHTLQPILK